MKIEKLGECPQLEQKEEGSQKSVIGQSISQYLFCWGNRRGRTRSFNWQFYVSHYEMEQFFLLPPDLCLVIVTSEQFRFVTHLYFSLSHSEISPHSSTCLFEFFFLAPFPNNFGPTCYDSQMDTRDLHLVTGCTHTSAPTPDYGPGTR